MAKKKAGGAKKAGKQKKATKGGKAKTAATKARHRQPRAEPLPGMGEVRIKALDEICTTIAETRESINALRAEEVDNESAAMGLMRKHEKVAWRHAGVELVRVPGEEKLRVRTTPERTATAESEPSDAGDSNNEGGGDDQGEGGDE